MTRLKKVLISLLLFSLLLNTQYSFAFDNARDKKFSLTEADISWLKKVIIKAIENLITQISANKAKLKAQVGGGQSGSGADVSSKPRPLALGACKPNKSRIECSGIYEDIFAYQDPLEAITVDTAIIIDKAEKECFQKYKNYLISHYNSFDEFRKDSAQYLTSILSEDGDTVLCTISKGTIEERDSDFLLKLNENLYFKRSFNNNFPQVYRPRYTKNKGNESINLNFEAGLFETDEYEIPKSKAVSNVWAALLSSFFTPKGEKIYSITLNNTPYRLSLDSEQDFTESLKSFNSDELVIDTTSSSWTLKTNGYVFGQVSGSSRAILEYEGGSRDSESIRTGNKKLETKFVNLKVCPTDCVITIEEQANIVASKKGSFEGPIKVKAYHRETSKGTVKDISFSNTDPTKSPQFQWKTLKVDTVDQRSANVDIKNDQGSIANIKYDYNTEFNEKKNYNTNQINKTKKIAESVMVSQRFFYPLPGSIPGSGNNENNNSKTINISSKVNITETQSNSNLQRQGTGSLSPNIQGIYDNKSPLMLVTAPDEMKGQRIDPMAWFGEFKNFVYPAVTLLWNIIPGQPYGLTTNFESDKSVTVATRPTVVLPQKVFVSRSYDRDDPAFSGSILSEFQKFLDELEANGVDIEDKTVNSENELMEYIKNKFTNGGWWIHLGHGEPDGLVIARIAEPDEIVPYHKIVGILNKKGVRLDVVALNSCYGGHIPIAAKVIGSISVIIANRLEETEGLGTLFGFGTNYFNYTAGDILKKLRELTGLGCQ
jgi:hypothetical protein